MCVLIFKRLNYSLIESMHEETSEIIRGLIKDLFEVMLRLNLQFLD